MRQLLLLTFLVATCLSCKKESTQLVSVTGNWEWILQTAGNPLYSSTPQTTGITEQLYFSSEGDYSMTRNGSVTNSGTYKLSTAKNTRGETISGLLCTNERIKDSVAYYRLTITGDTLCFDPNLTGSVGGGIRFYKRQ